MQFIGRFFDRLLEGSRMTVRFIPKDGLPHSPKSARFGMRNGRFVNLTRLRWIVSNNQVLAGYEVRDADGFVLCRVFLPRHEGLALLVGDGIDVDPGQLAVSFTQGDEGSIAVTFG